jgi:hypothetical protein
MRRRMEAIILSTYLQARARAHARACSESACAVTVVTGDVGRVRRLACRTRVRTYKRVLPCVSYACVCVYACPAGGSARTRRKHKEEDEQEEEEEAEEDQERSTVHMQPHAPVHGLIGAARGDLRREPARAVAVHFQDHVLDAVAQRLRGERGTGARAGVGGCGQRLQASSSSPSPPPGHARTRAR